MTIPNIDRHWIQIKKASYDTVATITQQPQSTRADHLTCGPRGVATWRLSSSAEIEVLNDEQLTIDGQTVHAEVNHLPAHVYRALVQASPAFTQYQDIDHLYQQIRNGKQKWDTAQFTRSLEEIAQEGRRPDQVPHLVSTPRTYSATWHPEEVLLRVNKAGDWFAALTFTASFQRLSRSITPVTVGLDLGLNPLTVAYTSLGESHTFSPTDLSHLDQVAGSRLSPAAQKILQHLTYASGREDAEKIIGWLNHHASRVFAERLSHRAMNANFIQQARNLAIHDHHFSALSQYLYTSRIPFRRVASYSTSQLCACCFEKEGLEVRGELGFNTFTCPRCKTVRCRHENAAHNVMLRGLNLPPRCKKSQAG